MKLRGYMLLLAGLAFGGALLGQAQQQRAANTRRQVDFKADKAYRTPNLDANAVIMVGEVVFHHNGAVISCDSAVRYSDRRIDCFKNVIINKGNSYAYGDRAEYNGDRNTARLYSPVIKVIDGDATLYTYNFTYNTKTEVGTWYGGGVMYQKDNVMESEKGYLYGDRDELVAVRNVQMKNDSHRIISDSVRYNSKTKVATFYTRTYIWTREGEIISAERGRYNTNDSTYFFHRNAYILDEFRETWADTIDFNARTEDALFYGNIQIDDNEHDSSAFGDYGQYWGERGETMLTKTPSMLNYGDQQSGDTLYMRSDTLFMFVIYPSDSPRKTVFADEKSDPNAHLRWTDSLPDSVKLSMIDSLRPVIARLRAEADSLRRRSDSIMDALYPAPAPPPITAIAPPQDSLAGSSVPDTLSAGESLSGADGLTSSATLASTPDTAPVSSDSVAPPAASKKDRRATRKSSRERGPNPGFGRWFWPEDGNFVETVSAQNAQPPVERKEPPEVQKMRARVVVVTAEADSLQRVVDYLTPKTSATPPTDSLAIARADSLKRVDSLGRVDSIRTANPKAYKKLEKIAQKRLKAQQKAEKQKTKEAVRAERFRIEEEERAAKTAAKAEKKAAKEKARRQSIAARRRRVAWVLDMPMVDSIARMDSIRRLDSLAARRVDSLETLTTVDSLAHKPATEPAEPDSTMRTFRGWHNVRIWRRDVQAVCDSMVGFSKDSTLHMYIDPVLWYGESQVVADSITAFTAGGSIDRAEFFGDPIMSSQLTERQFNQVTGRTMTAFFDSNAVYRHDVYGNSQALYYVQEDDSPEPVAFIVATSSNMTFLIEDNYVRYIVARDQVDWPIYPIDQIPPTQPTRLKGFQWYIERKPSLPDVFARSVRPTERVFYDSLPQPEFPIAARILRRREYLIANRMWGDRVDPLPSHAVEYVRSLGR